MPTECILEPREEEKYLSLREFGIGEVEWISEGEQVRAAAEEVLGSEAVGVDSEQVITKTKLDGRRKDSLALLQVATREKVFVFDAVALQGNEAMRRLVVELLESEAVKKVRGWMVVWLGGTHAGRRRGAHRAVGGREGADEERGGHRVGVQGEAQEPAVVAGVHLREGAGEAAVEVRAAEPVEPAPPERGAAALRGPGRLHLLDLIKRVMTLLFILLVAAWGKQVTEVEYLEEEVRWDDEELKVGTKQNYVHSYK